MNPENIKTEDLKIIKEEEKIIKDYNPTALDK